MKLKWAALALALAAVGSPAAAQKVVGTSLIDSRTVQLMSDFTWRYVSPNAVSCEPIQDHVSFCAQDTGWKRLTNDTSEAAATFRLNDRTYGLFIVESLGLDDGVTLKLMRSAVLENAGQHSGGAAKNIPVLGVEPAKVDDVAAETVIYVANSDGMSFVFLNTIAMGKNSTVQVVTYHVGKTVTDEMKTQHKRFIDLTRLK